MAAIYVEIRLDSVTLSEQADSVVLGLTYRLTNAADVTLAQRAVARTMAPGDLGPDLDSLVSDIKAVAVEWGEFMLAVNAISGSIGQAKKIQFRA